jgi:hypothetical protein
MLLTASTFRQYILFKVGAVARFVAVCPVDVYKWIVLALFISLDF